ncbi:epsE [Symbiodinium microadriaticum]|nr:epsE [Symbiodinium microadriaticum]
MKALLRRMVASDALGRGEAALKDAKDILILEPKNSHAMQVVARKRKSLTKKASDALPLSTGQPETTVAVFLFSEDRPLQCYACLRSLQKHLHGAALHVTVFWQAAERACVHSYQLLEALPELRSLQHGEIAWLEVSKGQLYSNFSRTVSRLSADGIRHLLILSDAAVFHTSTDVAAASALLSERSETFAVRLDLNPRIEYFSEAELYAFAPRSKPFANDPRLMVWTRCFDSSKMAYEAVPRESGWDDILCWTASLLRAEHVAHFFSALQGKQVDNVKELDEKAADWLSRRQRMKRREVSICTACFVEPLLITFDASGFGSAKEADSLLRAHLLHDLGGKVVQPVLPLQCWIVLAVLQWTPWLRSACVKRSRFKRPMKDLVEPWISKAADGARCQVESVDFKLCGGQMQFEVLGVEIGNLAPYMSDWMLRIRNVNFVACQPDDFDEYQAGGGLDQLVIEELTLGGLEITIEKRRSCPDNVEELLNKIQHNRAPGSYPNEGKLLIKKMQAQSMVVHLVLPMPHDEPCTLSLLGPSIHSTDLSESHGEADRMIQLLLKEIIGSASRATALVSSQEFGSVAGMYASLVTAEASFSKLARQLSWSEAEVASYFQSVDEGAPLSILDGLLQPERYREHYFDSARVSLTVPLAGPPRELGSEPLVSWLIPARNCEDFLLDCFRSIEQQVGVAAGSYEIVVVEDASEDGASAILQHYADKRPNVRIVDSNGKQQGVAGCLREGWEHCRGRFVARLDADDEADLQRLSKQLRYMEQHPSVSVLGGRHRSFFTEHRKFTVERISKKEDGRVVAAVWREFHGQQTSRAREQICLAEKGEQVLVVEGPAEYLNCRLLRVGEESMVLHPERWQEALSAAQGGRGEVLLLRRDPLEPAQGGRWMHPCLVRAASLFEECVLGTTCLFRKSHFGEECPFKREEAENHWLWLGLESNQHAMNIADVLVHTRPVVHKGNDNCMRVAHVPLLVSRHAWT